MSTNEMLAVYSEFRAQLAELDVLNKTLVFNYEDAKDQKLARSHVYKLRQLKSAIETRRAEAKKESLEYGRKVDAQANTIKAEIESMIDVHMTPIQAIELREKEQETYRTQLIMMLQQKVSFDNVDTVEHYIQQIDYRKLNEAHLPAMNLLVDETLSAIAKTKEARQKHEADMLELERLRKEAALRQEEENAKIRENERLAREHSERVEAEQRAKEDEKRKEEIKLLQQQQELLRLERENERTARAAIEQADAERKAKEQREKDEAERIIRQQQEQLRLEREKLEQEKRDRILQEQKDAELARQDALRKAGIEHRKNINQTILEALQPYVLDVETGRALIVAIVKDQIPNVKIEY